MTTRLPGIRCLVAALLAASLITLAMPSRAGQSRIVAEGGEDYARHCAACHGLVGRGDGPMASSLVREPTDLTGIAARHGGAFPFWRVYRIIDGSETVAGHETFQMPHFAARLARDDAKPGYPPAYLRILMLTHFLEAIQEP